MYTFYSMSGEGDAYQGELITDNEEEGTNYHCQGVRGATVLPRPWEGGGEAR